MRNLLAALAGAFLLASTLAVSADQVLPTPQIDNAGNLKFRGGPTLGRMIGGVYSPTSPTPPANDNSDLAPNTSWVKGYSAPIPTARTSGRTVTLDGLLKSKAIEVTPDFCDPASVGTGASGSDNTCFAAALTQACSQGNGVVDLGPYTYKVNNVTSNCSMKLRGAGAGRTRIDYSGVANSGTALTFQPAGFPAVTHQQLLYGVEISGIEFSALSVGTGSWALALNGCNSCSISDYLFTGNLVNGIKLYGVYKATISNHSSNYFKNVGTSLTGIVIGVYGDLAGKSRSGAACSIGDCSTRTDLVTIINLDHLGTNTGNCLLLSGIVNTTKIYGMDCQNKLNPIETTCPTGFPNISYCPQFIQGFGLNAEGFKGQGARLVDMTDFQCFGCYFIGDGVAPLADKAVHMQLLNYTRTAGSGGGLRLIGGRYGNVGSNVVYAKDAQDLTIENAFLWGGNLGNIGANAVTVEGVVDARIINNMFCKMLGGIASPSMGAIQISSITGDAYVAFNSYRGCTYGLSATASGTVINTGNVGP